MAWTPQSRVEEFCQKTGWTFYTQYVWRGKYWRSRFLDSNGLIMVQTLHKNPHTSIDLAVRMADSQQEVLLNTMGATTEDELPGPLLETDEDEEGQS